jgi:phage I-like protein
VLIAPWGRVESSSGDFVVDEESARLALAAFAEHGTDLPIDYEHQTLGGDFASPSGQAPAAGWIKRLEADAAVGIFADVEWTPPAVEQLAARQYRYLSPVAIVRRADRKLIGLHSAALTNKPAIVGMPAIVNKAVGPSPELDAEALRTQRERVQDPSCDPGGEAECRQDARSTTGCRQDACTTRECRRDTCTTTEDRPDTCTTTRRQVATATLRDAGDTCRQDAGATDPDAGATGGDAEREDVAAGDEWITALSALCGRLGLTSTSGIGAVLIAANERLAQAEAREAQRRAEEHVAVALRAGKLSEAQRGWALELALKDPAAFAQWLASAPLLVPLGRMAAPESAPHSGPLPKGARETRRVTAARAEFRAHPELAAITSEEAFVADALREF